MIGAARAELPLRRIAARTIVGAVADAAERWTDADFPPRVRATAAIESRLGYTMPVVDYALDRLFGGMTHAALAGAIAAELGDLAALDGFVPSGLRPDAWARGVDRVTIVSSEPAIGVAIAPLAYALCAKSRVTVKDRSDALVAPFAETLGEALPALRDAIEVQTWRGDDATVEDIAFGQAEVVVAFGSPDTLRAIRAACAPATTFVPFDHLASAGYVDRAALDGNLAALTAAIARDRLPVLFLERCDDDARRRFERALTDAYEASAIEFPAGARQPALGLGAVEIVMVGGPEDAGAYVRHHALTLQAVATSATSTDAAAELAVRLGVVRVAPFGELQAPPFGGHHGGRARIADFVRWIDRE